jgi:aryl-alcohol dehydrogenase-like predicted oxidoreductase
MRPVGSRLAAGSATPEGSAAHAVRLGPAGSTALGATGLTVSRVGFGGYRVDDETAEHREALERALRAGCNLIDTSTNYTDGASERLVGLVLDGLMTRGALRRPNVVVVSKIGYVQGQNLALAREREASGEPFPEMVKYMDGCWHCLHPDFLHDQLGRSLDRLGLETLDVCLLHNPEYFLSDARHRRAGPLPALRDEFYRRLRESFRYLERQADEGRLRWYGVSSNTAVAPATDPEAASVARMLEAAREAGGAGHRFRVLQFPMNLVEAGGFLERNTGPGGQDTALALAAREGLGVLVNRPLNAVVGNGMLRLADAAVPETGISLEVQMGRVGQLEDEYRREIAAELQGAEGSMAPDDFFRWATHLDGAASRIGALEQWREIEEYRILPHVAQTLRVLDEGLTGPLAGRWRAWRARYVPELDRLLAGFRRQAAVRSQARSQPVTTAIEPWLPAERRGESLSRKALWVLASTPGVSCVLNGMRRPAYVDDALGILGWPPLADVRPVYDAVRALDRRALG